MNVYKYPTLDELEVLLKRPVRDASELNATVSAVLQDVRQRGDAAVREYDYSQILKEKDELIDLSCTYDDMRVVAKMKEIVPEYKSQHSKYEVLDKK